MRAFCVPTVLRNSPMRCGGHLSLIQERSHMTNNYWVGLIVVAIVGVYTALKVLMGKLQRARIEIKRRDDSLETILLEKVISDLKEKAEKLKEKTDAEETGRKSASTGCNRCGANPCRCGRYGL
jgi:hypothetical protein